MSETAPTTTTAETQGAETQTADKQTEATAGTQTAPQTSEAQTEKTVTQTELNRILAKERKEWEKKATDAEARTKLSEEERATAEIQELRTQIRTRDARDAIVTEAAKLGVTNPNMLYKLVGSDIEFDAKGAVTNLKELLDNAKAEYPELFATKKPHGSADGGAGSGGGGRTLTKESVAKMSHAEINANWDDVQKFLAGQK